MLLQCCFLHSVTLWQATSCQDLVSDLGKNFSVALAYVTTLISIYPFMQNLAHQ